jgi:hypothetical protein
MGDPENWLETGKLMDLIDSDDFQDRVTLWIYGSWKAEEFEGEMTWSLALKQTMALLDGSAIRKMKKKNDWNDIIKCALADCKTQEMKDCGLFWIAHYTLLKGLVKGKIRLQHCALPIRNTGSGQEGT